MIHFLLKEEAGIRRMARIHLSTTLCIANHEEGAPIQSWVHLGIVAKSAACLHQFLSQLQVSVP
jgi:hypothetical protein